MSWTKEVVERSDVWGSAGVRRERWYEMCFDRKVRAKIFRQGVDEVAAVRRKNTCAANRINQTQELL